MTVEELAQRLISWIGGQVLVAGGEGAVVGMSGGLDSSVVAVLCQQAFADKALGLIMPCHSGGMDVAHAQAVARQFRIRTQTVVLDGVFDVLCQTLPGAGLEPATRGLAEANLKPRLRMVALYYLAKRLGYLVVGSSNRSELAVGYFTKYGDGGADILPLGDLVKGQVRELAAHLGISQQIIDKPPSAGLWSGQTDEEEMGLTYEELDRYLTSGEAGAELKGKIDSMRDATAHKRSLPAMPSF
ncbi:MAG: NAD(+) synthase [Dehalococcoidia bacterium]